MENKIVIHMKGGAIHKGVTQDFHPKREAFHLLPAEGGGIPLKVRVDEMKALFYVKDYVGNRDFVARRQFDEAKRIGKRAILTFHDGESIWGTMGEETNEGDSGFYFFPSDKEDNNIRIFVVRSSLKGMRLVE